VFQDRVWTCPSRTTDKTDQYLCSTRTPIRGWWRSTPSLSIRSIILTMSLGAVKSQRHPKRVTTLADIATATPEHWFFTEKNLAPQCGTLDRRCHKTEPLEWDLGATFVEAPPISRSPPLPPCHHTTKERNHRHRSAKELVKVHMQGPTQSP
jgi:hypothetical protein